MKLLTQSEFNILPGDVWIGLGEIKEYSGGGDTPDDEARELDKFNSEERRKEYVATRRIVRALVKRMGLDASSFSLQKDGLGKPFGIYGSRRLNVSIAHTSDFVLCGISADRPLGIDLEPVGRKVDGRVRNRILQPSEREALEQIDLIRIWTIKEALVKLEGKGLRTNLNEVIVSPMEENEFSARFNNDKSARICSFKHDQYWIALAQYL